MTYQYLDDAYDAMIECALWSSLAYGPTEQDDPIPADELHDESHIPREVIAELRTDLADFIAFNLNDLEVMDPKDIGHDFWLTRNHHGAGFWDRGLGERGQRLTEAAHVYGEIDLQLYYRYDKDGEPCLSE